MILTKLYRKFVQGADSIGSFLKKNLFATLQIFECEENVFFSHKIKIDLSANLQGASKILVGKNTKIKEYVRINLRGGSLKIGKRCSINPFCIFYVYGNIVLGDNVRIASGTKIISFSHVFSDRSKSIIDQGNSMKGINIGDDVWIGADVKILDGVSIGKGAVIGAGSTVTKSIPDYEVYAGSPAKKILSR